MNFFDFTPNSMHPNVEVINIIIIIINTWTYVEVINTR